MPLFSPLQEGVNVFSPRNLTPTRLDKQPSMHTSTRAHAHSCLSSPQSQHLFLAPENPELPFQRDVPSVFAPNPTH